MVPRLQASSATNSAVPGMRAALAEYFDLAPVLIPLVILAPAHDELARIAQRALTCEEGGRKLPVRDGSNIGGGRDGRRRMCAEEFLDRRVVRLGAQPDDWVPGEASPAPFFFQAEDGIRDLTVTGVQTCALPI